MGPLRNKLGPQDWGSCDIVEEDAKADALHAAAGTGTRGDWGGVSGNGDGSVSE